MAHDLSEASAQFAELARNLTAVGLDDLRRELNTAVSDAARELVHEEKSAPRIRAYMPDRYADLFAADLKIDVFRRTTGEGAGVGLLARAPTAGGGGRKVRQRDLGNLVHPIFGQGARRSWRWVGPDDGRKGITPGWFTDPAQAAAPQVREAIVAAMERVALKATGKG